MKYYIYVVFSKNLFLNIKIIFQATKVFGLNFPNPIGMAAGFDKDAEAINGLANVGFGFVEVINFTKFKKKIIQCCNFNFTKIS